LFETLDQLPDNDDAALELIDKTIVNCDFENLESDAENFSDNNLPVDSEDILPLDTVDDVAMEVDSVTRDHNDHNYASPLKKYPNGTENTQNIDVDINQPSTSKDSVKTIRQARRKRLRVSPSPVPKPGTKNARNKRPLTKQNNNKKQISQKGKKGPNSNNKKTNGQKKKPTMKWDKKPLNISEEEIRFTGENILPDEIKYLDTPLQYFLYFFPPDLIQHIAEQSTLFATQNNPDKPFIVTTELVRKYLGLFIASSIMPVRNMRLFWNKVMSVSLITF